MEKIIFEALKNKYKNLGFSDKAFEGVAKFMATTVTDEASIETAIGGVEILLKSFQGDIDKRVTDAVTKAKAEKGASKQDEPSKTPGDEPDALKSLTEMVQNLSNELTTMKAGTTTNTRKQSLEAILKDADSAFSGKVLKDFSRMQFKDDEEFNSYIEETKTALSAFTQSLTDRNMAGHPRPALGNANKDGVSSNVQAFIDEKTKKDNSGDLGGKQV